MREQSNYRPDIDGLRALSVLAVVFFHLGEGGLRGGFIGVDIFFVISGYLISQQLLRERAAGSFSLATFYSRRIRRIFPAYFFASLAITVAVFLSWPGFLLPDYFKALLSTSLLVSNVYFAHSLGSYWGQEAHSSPLLHMWSLSIEEQYYLILPLVFLGITRARPSLLAPLIAALAAVSYGMCLYASYVSPIQAFYVGHLRFWELLLGSLPVVFALKPIRNSRSREALSLLGLLMISIPVFTYTSSTIFPGIAALCPCVGALLLIHPNQEKRSFVSRLLSNRALVTVGLASYSIYLWHWPLLKFTQHELSTPYLRFMGYPLISVLLGIISWRLIEIPFRRRLLSGWSLTRLVVLAVLATAVLVGFTYAGIASSIDKDSSRLKFRFDMFHELPNALECEYRLTLPNESTYHYLCTIGDPEVEPDFILLGDSIAFTAVPSLAMAATNAHRAGYVAVAPGCLPSLVGFNRERKLVHQATYGPKFLEHCDEFSERIVTHIGDHRTRIQTIIQMSRWENLDRERLPPQAVKDGLGRITSEFPDKRHYIFGPPATNKSEQHYRETNHTFLKAIPELQATYNFTYVDLSKNLCVWDGCPKKDIPMYKDATGHFMPHKPVRPLTDEFMHVLSDK